MNSLAFGSCELFGIPLKRLNMNEPVHQAVFRVEMHFLHCSNLIRLSEGVEERIDFKFKFEYLNVIAGST